MNQQVHEIELTIEEAKAQVELSKALDRLNNNSDFKKVVIEGYLKSEAMRLVHSRSNPSMQTPDLLASNLKDIEAIGSFLAYLRLIRQLGDQATSAIAQCNQALEEIAQEGV